jgi:hypothetical protein
MVVVPSHHLDNAIQPRGIRGTAGVPLGEIPLLPEGSRDDLGKGHKVLAGRRRRAPPIPFRGKLVSCSVTAVASTVPSGLQGTPLMLDVLISTPSNSEPDTSRLLASSHEYKRIAGSATGNHVASLSGPGISLFPRSRQKDIDSLTSQMSGIVHCCACTNVQITFDALTHIVAPDSV